MYPAPPYPPPPLQAPLTDEELHQHLRVQAQVHEESMQRERDNALAHHLRQGELERRALFESEFYRADLWKTACITALTGVNMGLANAGAVEAAIKAADSVLDAFKKRFPRSGEGNLALAPVVSIVREP